jgi:hypothetical protein
METNRVTTADPEHPAYTAARVGASIQILPGLYFKFGIGSKKTMILKAFIDQMLDKCDKIFKTPQSELDKLEKHVSYEDAKKKLVDSLD